jgi:uncharacterized protein with beta-barrel porin domain
LREVLIFASTGLWQLNHARKRSVGWNVADLALTTAGAEWRLTNGVSFLVKFDGEFGDRSETYSGTGRIRYTW